MLTKYCNNDNYGYHGFTDDLYYLEPEDDAATVNWSSGWSIPDDGQWEELLNRTTKTWTTQNGVNGVLFVASNGYSIFLPAAGRRSVDLFFELGNEADYWSTALYLVDPTKAEGILCNDALFQQGITNRTNGLTIRPVRSSRK